MTNVCSKMWIACIHGTSDPTHRQPAWGSHHYFSQWTRFKDGFPSRNGLVRWVPSSISRGSAILGVHPQHRKRMLYIASGGRSLWAGLGRSGARRRTATSQGAGEGTGQLSTWNEEKSAWLVMNVMDVMVTIVIKFQLWNTDPHTKSELEIGWSVLN